MGKKKLLILHPELVVGGAERVLINMLNNIDISKFDITLILRNPAVWDILIPARINVYYLFKVNPRKKNRFCARLYKYCMIFCPSLIWMFFGPKQKYDTIISYHEPMLWFLSCTRGKRKVLWIHSDYSKREYAPEVKELGDKNGLLAALISSRRNKLINSLDNVVFVAESCIAPFVKFTGFDSSKAVVLYNLNDEISIKEKAKEKITDVCWNEYKGAHLVMCGRISHEKAMHRLIPLMKHLKEDKIDAKIFIIGDGDLRSDLENQISQSMLKDKFILLGYQSNPYKYICRAKLVLICSPSEAYCTVTKESILLGTPFVTTDCSGMREQIGATKAGIIVPQGEDTLFTAVESILMDYELYNDMKIGVQIRQNNLSDARNINQIEKFLFR